jgi:hypothetical protein
MVVASAKKAWASETFCCFSASELTVPVSMVTRSSPFASRSFPSSECRVSTLLTQVRLLASPLLENVPAEAEKLNASVTDGVAVVSAVLYSTTVLDVLWQQLPYIPFPVINAQSSAKARIRTTTQVQVAYCDCCLLILKSL